MKHRVAVVWVSLAMMLSIIVIVVELAPPVRGATITVDYSGGADYMKIQDAINASDPGGTVFVYNGIYTENVVINKTISLIGEDRETTFIDGGFNDNSVLITADWVNLTGFTVAQGGLNFMENAGLKVDSDNNSIFNNTMTFCEGHAMLLNDSHDNYIHNNTITINEQGLWLQYSSHNNFFNNTFSNNDQCLTIKESSFNTFTGNTNINSFYSVSMTSSNNNSFLGNNISNNQYGAELYSCSDSTFIGNTFNSNNHGGLKTRFCVNISVTYNEFYSNGDHGLLMEGPVGFDVNNNTFDDSGILLTGTKLPYWNTHVIDSTNTLNGKPVYYWKDRNGGVIPAGAGQVILANCTEIDVRDQKLTYGVAAVELGFSIGNNIIGNDLSYNDYGVYSIYSDFNNISGNEAALISEYGIYLWHSSYNNVTGNNFSWIGDHGIHIEYSANNSIIDNVISYSGSSALSIIDSTNTTVVNNRGFDGSQGIRLIRSNYNVITGNNISSMSNRGIALISGGQWNVIENNTLLDNYYGISMESLSGKRCDNNTISYNIILENMGPGIWIYDCEGITIEGNNILSGQSDGISLSRVLNSHITNNTVVSSRNYGLKLLTSQYINVTGNEFTEDGIFISGTEVSHFNSHEIPENNLVNGNPVRYIKDDSNITIDGEPTGQVIIANCQDINLANLVINNTDCGIELAFSTRISMYENNISYNDENGIYLYESSYCKIQKSDIFSNGDEGISLRQSPDCDILWNNISLNDYYNLLIDFSPNCNITGNYISNSTFIGIFIQASSNSIFQDNLVYNHLWGLQANALTNFQLIGNDFFNNVESGMHIQGTTGTKIVDNQIFNNSGQGIEMYTSTGANITGNSFTLNEGYGLYLERSSGCEFTNNVFTHDGMVIVGYQLSDYNSHTILDNNLVNGAPLYYYKNTDGITIDGIPVGQLILANCNDVDIKNIEIIDTDVGIEAVYSTALDISGNNISSNNVIGLYLVEVNDSNLTANTVSHNEIVGAFLQASSNLNISDNLFERDGIFILGHEVQHYDSHTIPTNNMVNGRPIYYLVNMSGLEFDGIPVGQLILVNCTSVNASNLLLDDASVGLEAISSEYINISSSQISNNNYHGLYLAVTYGKIYSNNISNNYFGIYLDNGRDTEISANNITYNYYGIFNNARDTRVFHNNFIENDIQAENDWGEGWWDDGYPSGGNYWSDHSPTCPDLYSGPDWPQKSGSPDGICDEPYDVVKDAYDRYPLKYPWGVVISWDYVAPSSVLDLDVLDWDADSLTLTWTAPGDDGDSGTATGYVIKYSTSGPITNDEWDTADVYSQSWTPLGANSTETHVISGLEPNRTYWFAIKAFDEMNNYGGISNSPSQKTNHTDMTPPAAILDFDASDPTNSSITLTWTAPADNGTDASSGNALFYDIRYNIDSPVTEGGWDSATPLFGVPSPGTPGTTETHEVTGLLSGTNYYFAIKALDEAPHWSPISNSPNETTLGLDISPPLISEITADPWTQEIGEIVTISAKVTDNVDVYFVSVEVRDPFSTVIGNYTMVRIGNYYHNETIYTDPLGIYNFTIWAVDTSNNIAFKNRSFEMIEMPPVAVDTSPPTIDNTQASPSSQELDEPLNISASVVDNVEVEKVWIQILNPDGIELENVSMFMIGSSDEFWYKRTFSELGDYIFRIWAKDTSDNWNFTEESFVIQDTNSPISDAGECLEITQGETVNFDGSGSSDNGEITNYTWDFDYDEETIILYGVNPSFRFVNIGNYTITLTVFDPSGNSASTTIWINVVGVDRDGDRLTDYDEDNIYGTKPDNPDTDGDGINDGDEIQGGTDPLVPDKGKEPEKSIIDNYWWIFLIIAVIIILILLFFLSKRKEEEIIKEEEKIEEEPSEPDEPKEPAPETPTSPDIAEQDVEPVSEAPPQPEKRKPPRPPRAPKSRT